MPSPTKTSPVHSNIPIIEVRDVSFGYNHSAPVYDQISFSVNPGEILGIVGHSGSGKTTLAYLLKGIIPHSIKGHLSGEILVDGKSVRRTKLPDLARCIGMVFQDLNAQIFSNTVLEEVQFGLHNFKLDLGLAEVALKKLNIWHLKDKIPMNLSAGQKQRVILASVIALSPKILILDEPSIHLDDLNKQALRDWLFALHAETNMTILIASNDPWLIGQMCEKILFIENQQVDLKQKSDVMERKQMWSWAYDNKTSL